MMVASQSSIVPDLPNSRAVELSPPTPEPLSSGKKRIAHNTLMLFIRMGVLMVVTLYTSRIVLKALGVSDYGIYNIVGGVVVLFAFLNNAMSNATQRFLSYALGQNEPAEVARIFSMSMTAHLGIAVLLVIVAETAGLWFLIHKIVIPQERLAAALWAYQFSLLAAVTKILLVPYNALIIAHERMTFYAYASIAEAALGLAVAFSLARTPADRLVFYAMLVLISAGSVFVIYYIHCRRTFPESKYIPIWDRKLFSKIFAFSGWSLLGNAANSTAAQGINIIFNLFYGIATNAAMGIANQMNSAIGLFSGSFQTAFNPQIVKLYSSGDRSRLFALITQTTKCSFFLLVVVALPLLINTEFILGVWLGNVPPRAPALARILIVSTLILSFNGPLWMTAQAAGNIRNYQLCISGLVFLNVPVAYGMLRVGFSPEYALAFNVIVNLAATWYRISYLGRIIAFPVRSFLRDSAGRCLLVVFIYTPAALWLAYGCQPGWVTLGLSFVGSVLVVGPAVFFLGLQKSERAFIINGALVFWPARRRRA